MFTSKSGWYSKDVYRLMSQHNVEKLTILLLIPKIAHCTLKVLTVFHLWLQLTRNESLKQRIGNFFKQEFEKFENVQ